MPQAHLAALSTEVLGGASAIIINVRCVCLQMERLATSCLVLYQLTHTEQVALSMPLSCCVILQESNAAESLSERGRSPYTLWDIALPYERCLYVGLLPDQVSDRDRHRLRNSTSFPTANLADSCCPSANYWL